MFMFSDPPPIDYRITGVSPSYLSDGIFHHGNPSPTHKHIAKQLKPIRRTLADPVAPVRELDPRTLNSWIEKEKAGYVDPCSRAGDAIHDTLGLMPKYKIRRTIQPSLASIFPRSPQYELWYIRNKRVKDFQERQSGTVECAKAKEKTKLNDEPYDLSRDSCRLENGKRKSESLRYDDKNNYAIKCLETRDQNDSSVSRSNHQIKTQNPDDTSMKEVLDRPDSCKIILGNEDLPRVRTLICNKDTKIPTARAAYTTVFDKDRRWQMVYDEPSFPETDEERQEELRKLTKPFLHELHAWYAKNKPTELILPVRVAGKRPIPERRFSHL